MSTFAERFLELKKSDESMLAFLTSLNLKTAHLVAWRGGSVPTIPLIKRIAERRGVSPAWLAFGDDYPKKRKVKHVS